MAFWALAKSTTQRFQSDFSSTQEPPTQGSTLRVSRPVKDYEAGLKAVVAPTFFIHISAWQAEYLR